MNYSFTRRRSRQEEDNLVSLAHFEQYAHSLETIAFFVQNVSLDEEAPGDIFSIFQRCIAKFKFKIIKPMKDLCMKFLNEGKGVNQLHTLFVQICLHYGLERQALCVIQAIAIPQMELGEYASYLYHSAMAYIYLRKYKQAKNSLNKIFKLQKQNQIQQILLSKTIIMTILLNKMLGLISPSLQKIEQMCQDIVKSIPPYKSDRRQYFQQLAQIIYQMFQSKDKNQLQKICEMIKLDPIGKVLVHLDSSAARKKAENNYITNNYQRVKVQQIQQKALNNPEDLIKLNIPTKVGTYDCQKGIITFNYVNVRDQAINVLVGECYEMERLSVTKEVSSQYAEEKRGSGMNMLYRSKRAGFPF